MSQASRELDLLRRVRDLESVQASRRLFRCEEKRLAELRRELALIQAAVARRLVSTTKGPRP